MGFESTGTTSMATVIGDSVSPKSQFAFVFSVTVAREDEMRAGMNELASELCDEETLPLVLAFAQQHRFLTRGTRSLPPDDRLHQTQAKKAGWKMNNLFIVVWPEYCGRGTDDPSGAAGVSIFSRPACGATFVVARHSNQVRHAADCR